jgi:phenylalanyl-tRNA synthetase beta chain
MTLCLADRGGKIYSIKVKYKNRNETTPVIKRQAWNLKLSDVNSILGIGLKPNQVAALLRRMNYSVSKTGKTIKVTAPCYRTDIMHAVDIIEDISIAYGYDRIKPREPEIPTYGGLDETELFSDSLRDLIVGAGYLETMGFVLSSKELQQGMMDLEELDVTEIENPMSETYSCLRTWLMPSLLQFLGRNTNKEYPQRVFELGEVVVPTKSMPETRWKLCAADASSNSTFTGAKSVLDAVMNSIPLKYSIKRKNHPTFIPGRCGEIVVKGKSIGIIGEVHPKILENFGISVPVSGFDFYVEEVMKGRV